MPDRAGGFESTLQPGIHVLGDAALMGAMPKAAHAAAVQGRVCAAAVVAKLRERAPDEPQLDNLCYSLAAPDWGFVETNKYRPENGLLTALPGAVDTSPLGAKPEARAARGAATTKRGSARSPASSSHEGRALLCVAAPAAGPCLGAARTRCRH